MKLFKIKWHLHYIFWVCYDKITRSGKEIHLEQGNNKALVTLLFTGKQNTGVFFMPIWKGEDAYGGIKDGIYRVTL